MEILIAALMPILEALGPHGVLALTVGYLALQVNGVINDLLDARSKPAAEE